MTVGRDAVVNGREVGVSVVIAGDLVIYGVSAWPTADPADATVSAQDAWPDLAVPVGWQACASVAALPSAGHQAIWMGMMRVLALVALMVTTSP